MGKDIIAEAALTKGKDQSQKRSLDLIAVGVLGKKSRGRKVEKDENERRVMKGGNENAVENDRKL